MAGIVLDGRAGMDGPTGSTAQTAYERQTPRAQAQMQIACHAEYRG